MTHCHFETGQWGCLIGGADLPVLIPKCGIFLESPCQRLSDRLGSRQQTLDSIQQKSGKQKSRKVEKVEKQKSGKVESRKVEKYFWLLWLLLATLGYFWILLCTFWYFLVLLATFGYFWQLFATFGYFWLFFVTFDYFWLLLDIFGYFCQLLAPFG